MLTVIISEQRDQISPLFKQIERPYANYTVTEFELETANLPRHHKVDLHCIRFRSRGGLLTSERESIPFMNVSGKFYY